MMRKAKFAQLAALIVSALVSTQVWAQDRGDPEIGLALARRTCAECHAILARQPQSPHPLAPTFHTIANVPGMNGIALTVALRRSHETMPNLILESSELRNLIAYILSLRQ